MKHLDLFSGIGGFALAAEWAGMETIGFVEIDRFCQKVLRKHWPDVKIVSDIHDVKEGSFEAVGIITGGFPCQPFSVAGKRRGKKDDRYLWPAMLNVIKIYKPTWVISENAAGIISMELPEVLSSLESEGYEAQTLVIPACAVGAPHRRDRVWIIAYSESKSCNERNNNAGVISQHKAIPKLGNNGGKSFAANTKGAGLQGRKYTEGEKRTGQFSRSGSNERASWNKDWIEVATEFCRMDDGVPNRVDRIKALGNAIVPQVAYEIMKTIMEAECEKLHCD